jgi:uncharacterized protein YegJ (DUF2314 family)
MTTWPVEKTDPEMNAAVEAARSSIGDFLEAFLNPSPNQSSFLLKVRFISSEETEHIWLADLDLGPNKSAGTVANETNFPGLAYMQRVSFTPDQITDWMYFEDGALVGGFTTRLLMRRSNPQ